MISAFFLALTQIAAPSHTHGHMIGEVQSDSAVVWTRADRAVDAELELSKTVDFAQSQVVPHTTRSGDHTFHFRVTGLDADTRYYYRSTLIDSARPNLRTRSEAGSFRTAPDTSTDVRFVAACEFYERQSYPGVAALEQEDPDFFLMLGDLPYSDKGVPATTLEAYRVKHAAVHAAPEFLSFLGKTPYFGVFDDHEVINDWDASKPAAQVQAGLQAWREWKPFLLPKGGEYYRSFAWGKELRVILLDTRSLRGANHDPDDAQHSMLGSAQKQWLLQELKTAPETFKLVVSSVPLRSGWKWRDHWEGYQRERTEIFAAIAKDKVEGVVFLTGDHHYSSRNHHAEGITEMVVGALDAHHNTPPLERDSSMLHVRTGACYVRGSVDASAKPKRLLLEIVQDGKVTLAETVEAAGALARGSLCAAPGDGALVLDGPRRVRIRGRNSRRLLFEPGEYVVHASSRQAGRYLAPPTRVKIAAGGSLGVGIVPDRSVADFERERVFEDFEGDSITSSFQTFEIGSPKSEWFVDGGRLWHSSRTSSGQRGEPGAQIVFGDELTDQHVCAHARSWGPESIGLLARHRGTSDYYWLELDAQRQRLVLGVRESDVFRELQAVDFAVENFRTYRLELHAIGDELRVVVDGHEWMRVTDTTHAKGKPGLACDAVNLAAFEDFVVRSAAPAAPALLRDGFEGESLDPSWEALDSFGKWHVIRGRLYQSEYVYDKTERGTNLLSKTLDEGDVSVRTELQVVGAGRAGLWCRYDAREGQGYRAWIDPARTTAAIELCSRDAVTTLATAQDLPLEVERRHELEFVAIGEDLILRLDGIEILRATDSTIATGRVGFHTFAQSSASFERFVVERFEFFGPIATLVGAAGKYEYQLHVPDAASSSVKCSLILMLSEDVAPPIDLSAFDIVPRVVPLDSTAFLQATGGGLDSSGKWALPFPIPQDPTLRGKTFYLGGVLLRSSALQTALRPAPSVPLHID